MKRFYKQVSVGEAGEAFEVLLDGRAVKTPARQPLHLPTRTLADASAAEWEAQGDKVDPRTMPVTGLANAAIDRVAPDQAAFAAGLARYGESDLLCYRAEHPSDLVEAQARAWDPLLAWARQRYDVDFEVTAGIIHRPQHPLTLDRLGQAIAARDPFELAALSQIVTISGSLVIALALAEGAVEADEAWFAATVDERYQAEKWGEDLEAARVLEARKADFLSAARFLTLL